MKDQIPHFAKNIFLGCIDDRLVKSHFKFVSEIGGAFVASIAGGGFACINPLTKDVIMYQMSASYHINRVNHVYLESHTDCGAYRLAGITFDSFEAEVNQLYNDLDKAADVVKQTFSNIGLLSNQFTITARVVDPSGDLIPRLNEKLKMPSRHASGLHSRTVHI